jgi:hypothetical protein
VPDAILLPVRTLALAVLADRAAAAIGRVAAVDERDAEAVAVFLLALAPALAAPALGAAAAAVAARLAALLAKATADGGTDALALAIVGAGRIAFRRRPTTPGLGDRGSDADERAAQRAGQGGAAGGSGGDEAGKRIEAAVVHGAPLLTSGPDRAGPSKRWSPASAAGAAGRAAALSAALALAAAAGAAPAIVAATLAPDAAVGADLAQ